MTDSSVQWMSHGLWHVFDGDQADNALCGAAFEEGLGDMARDKFKVMEAKLGHKLSADPCITCMLLADESGLRGSGNLKPRIIFARESTT